jgi:hypothetical protein
MSPSKKDKGFTLDLERTYKSMLMTGKFAYELPEFMLVDYLTSKTGRKKKGAEDDKG